MNKFYSFLFYYCRPFRKLLFWIYPNHPNLLNAEYLGKRVLVILTSDLKYFDIEDDVKTYNTRFLQLMFKGDNFGKFLTDNLWEVKIIKNNKYFKTISPIYSNGVNISKNYSKIVRYNGVITDERQLKHHKDNDNIIKRFGNSVMTQPTAADDCYLYYVPSKIMIKVYGKEEF